jgi:hypothetical protein
MLIITCDTLRPTALTQFTKALGDIGALQVLGGTWVLPGSHAASAVMDMLEPLLPSKDNDALFIAALDAFAELQWTNTVCSDAELGGLIRMARERAET